MCGSVGLPIMRAKCVTASLGLCVPSSNAADHQGEHKRELLCLLAGRSVVADATGGGVDGGGGDAYVSGGL